MGERYEIHFVEIGVDEDHVHFLVQSVSVISPKDIVQVKKSITGKEIFKRHPGYKDRPFTNKICQTTLPLAKIPRTTERFTPRWGEITKLFVDTFGIQTGIFILPVIIGIVVWFLNEFYLGIPSTNFEYKILLMTIVFFILNHIVLGLFTDGSGAIQTFIIRSIIMSVIFVLLLYKNQLQRRLHPHNDK